MQADNKIKREGGKRCQGVVKGKLGDKPLVSIITAVYNGRATMEETIKSVINQKYPNFEYLVIDGGSTDGTVELLKNYEDHIDYWVSEPDKGIYDALNKGIGLAQGEWLYFLGADDRIEDGGVLSRVFSEPRATHLLYGNVIWGRGGKRYGGAFDRVRLYLQNICQQAIFYHRNLFTTIGRFDLRYPVYADWVFNMRAFSVKRIHPTFIDVTVATYAIDGMSNRKSDETFERDKDGIFRSCFGMWTYCSVRIVGYIRVKVDARRQASRGFPANRS